MSQQSTGRNWFRLVDDLVERIQEVISNVVSKFVAPQRVPVKSKQHPYRSQRTR